jgi:DNA primase
MISRETVDKIFKTARIEEVIADFVQLKKSGSSLKGLSPFANEKSPSFMVSLAKQIFKDFGSGKGGTVVTFLMEH